jgi:hypothetical protein
MNETIRETIKNLVDWPQSKICKHYAAIIALNEAVDEDNLDEEELREYKNLVEALVNADDHRILDILS